MSYVQNFQVGDQFTIPWTREYETDTFTVMATRPWGDGYMLDAVCDGDDSIVISINAADVERI